MAIQTVTIQNFYTPVIRRNKNDTMDHFSDIGGPFKETQPKYLSVIDKEFIHIPKKTGQTPPNEKIIKFEFPARDTLNIGRTKRGSNTLDEVPYKLPGVNTNDKIITNTPNYEGISDENNLFHLLFIPF